VLFAILPRRLVVAQQINQETAGAEQWRALAQQLRVDSIRSSSGVGSGHPTSSMSAADLIAVLMSKYLSYDFDDPENPNNDHLIFSRATPPRCSTRYTRRRARSQTKSS
jgi:Transketolase, thiamine diphosphate binding domain